MAAKTATLECGTVLAYESAGFVPTAGETVPCRRHGYCVVARCEAGGRAGLAGSVRTRPPRSQRELLEHLRRRPVTTLHALRRHGFTLRLVVDAHKAGSLHVDLLAGRVVLAGAERNCHERS